MILDIRFSQLLKSLASKMFLLLFAVVAMQAQAMQALDDEDLEGVYGQGINTRYFAGDYFGCANVGNYAYSEQNNIANTSCYQNALNRGGVYANHASNNMLWETYRTDIDMIIKVAATVRTIRLGGYLTYWEGGSNGFNSGNSRGDKPGGSAGANQHYDWDVSFDQVRVGNVNCAYVESGPYGVANGGSGGGFCGDDERPFDPFTMENPYVELMFAPECELWGEACTAGVNTESVFAGIRFGAERASGNIALTINNLSGYMNAYVADDFYVDASAIPLIGDLVGGIVGGILGGQLATGVQIWGHRRDDIPSLDFTSGECGGGFNDFICVAFAGLIEDLMSSLLPPLGELLTNINLQEAQGLWVSMVRNDVQWPGQGTIISCGSYSRQAKAECTEGDNPANTVQTIRDRDFVGWNVHFAGGAWGHGGANLLGMTIKL